MADYFAQQIVCVTTGVDDPASQAWIEKAAELENHPFWKRASAHWNACSEDAKSAIASYFGWEEPTYERFPFAKAIKEDYTRSMEWASRLLNYDT